MQVRVLIAIRDSVTRRMIEKKLKDKDVFIQTLKQSDLKWARIVQTTCDIIIASRSLIPRLIRDDTEDIPNLPQNPAFIIISERDDVRTFAEFRAAGALAVFHAHLPSEILEESLISVIEQRREYLAKLIQARRISSVPSLDDFISASTAMSTFMDTVFKITKYETTILILGETGVGKERLARAIHADGPRAGKPFISVNCAALPENLIESELFGHEVGAFTGATRARRGAFEIAHRGTIFLDEIGEMPLNMQAKLLHVLQDYQIRPVGGEHQIPVDVRIMAATNRDLQRDVEEKRFRQDLFYRLNVLSLVIPPLRERKEDIPLLAQSYVAEISSKIGKNIETIHRDALDALIRYPWPVNVRELINIIERAILLSDGKIITISDLPIDTFGNDVKARADLLRTNSSLHDMPVVDEWLSKSLKEFRTTYMAQLEKAYLTGLLEKTQGRIGETARRAEIEPRSLHGKMKKYGLRKEDFKENQLK